jgi:hypothetical protein
MPEAMRGDVLFFVVVDLLLNMLQLVALFGIWFAIRNSLNEMTDAVDTALEVSDNESRWRTGYLDGLAARSSEVPP